MAKAVVPKKVLLYEDEHGKTPYAEWFTSLKDVTGKARIGARIRGLEGGYMAIVSQLAKASATYACFLARATGSILVKMRTIS